MTARACLLESRLGYRPTSTLFRSCVRALVRPTSARSGRSERNAHLVQTRAVTLRPVAAALRAAPVASSSLRSVPRCCAVTRRAWSGARVCAIDLQRHGGQEQTCATEQEEVVSDVNEHVRSSDTASDARKSRTMCCSDSDAHSRSSSERKSANSSACASSTGGRSLSSRRATLIDDDDMPDMLVVIL